MKLLMDILEIDYKTDLGVDSLHKRIFDIYKKNPRNQHFKNSLFSSKSYTSGSDGGGGVPVQ